MVTQNLAYFEGQEPLFTCMIGFWPDYFRRKKANQNCAYLEENGRYILSDSQKPESIRTENCKV